MKHNNNIFNITTIEIIITLKITIMEFLLLLLLMHFETVYFLAKKKMKLKLKLSFGHIMLVSMILRVN